MLNICKQWSNSAHNEIEEKDVITIAPFLTNLTILDICKYGSESAFNKIKGQGAIAIAKSLTNLITLNLSQ
jgi:hypothetical protein